MLTLSFKRYIGDPPDTLEYELAEGGKPVGFIQVRQKPSKSSNVPVGFENHIYYEIYPDYRCLGYGNKILELGLREVAKPRLKRVRLTCVSTNKASKKIIENNGGVLIDKKRSIDNKDAVLLYEIRL